MSGWVERTLGLSCSGGRLAEEGGLLFTVATFTEPWEAHIFRGRLEAEGIPAWVAHDQHITLNWPIATALGGAKVQVPPVFADQACIVERNYSNAAYQADLLKQQPDITDVRCPECGSGRFRSAVSVLKGVLVLLSIGLATVIFPPTGNQRVCCECGWRWQAG